MELPNAWLLWQNSGSRLMVLRFLRLIKECHPPSSLVPNLLRHELETTLGDDRDNFRAIRVWSPLFWSVGRNEGDVS